MAHFWQWSHSTTVPVPPPIAPHSMETVEIYTESAALIGQADLDGRRLSDVMNANSHLPLRDLRPTNSMDVAPEAAGNNWFSVSVGDILIAIPSIHVSAQDLRVHRRRHRVRVEVGPFNVVGNAHLMTGVTPDPYAMRTGMRFIAVTDAHVASRADREWERFAPVVLLNVRPHVGMTQAITTL